MPNQTVLEEMVIRLVGDVDQYVAALQESDQKTNEVIGRMQKKIASLEEETKRLGESHRAAFRGGAEHVDHMTQSHGRLMGSMRDMRHSLHLLGVTELIPHNAIRDFMMAFYAIHIAEHSVGNMATWFKQIRADAVDSAGAAGKLEVASRMITAMAPAAARAAGFFVAVLTVETIIRLFRETSEYSLRWQKTVSKGMEEMATGAKSVREAIAGVSVRALQGEMEDILEKLVALDNLSRGRDFLGGLGAALSFRNAGRDLSNLMAQVANSSATAGLLVGAMPRLLKDFLGILGSIQLNRQMRGTIEDIKEAERRTARLESNPIFRRLRETFIISQGREQAESLRSEMSREILLFGMGAEAKKVYAKAAELAAANNWSLKRAIEAINAASGIPGGLGRLADAQALLKGTEELKKLTDEIAKTSVALSKGSVEAEVFGLAMQLRAVAGLNSTSAALEKFNPLLEKYRSLLYVKEAQKLFEETRTPIEKYVLHMEQLQKMLKAGALDQNLYARAAEKAAHEILNEGKALEKLEAPLAGTAKAIDMMDEYLRGRRLKAPQDLTLFPKSTQPPTTWKDSQQLMQDQLQVMIEIRNAIQNGGKAPPGANAGPANLSVGGDF